MQSKNSIILGFLYLLIGLSFFDIFIIGSRGAILASYFLIGALIFCLVFKKKLSQSIPKKFSKSILIVISIFIGLMALQTYLYQNNEKLQVTNRSLDSYDSTDDSVNKRSRYYKHALTHLLNNPLIGSGIGTWKIISIFYDKEDITEYQIPYHTHNDFLQIGAETGFFGLLSYLLIFLSSIILLFIKIIKRKNDEKFFILGILLIISISIFIIDSMINFPRARPYSQMNIIYILVLAISLINSDSKKEQIKMNGITYIQVFVFLSLIPINYTNYKVFKSIQDQVYMYFDFNDNRRDLKIPIESAIQWDSEFPNLSTSSLPIDFIKANYFIKEKKYEEAKRLITKGNKVNPYLGIGELNLAIIYYEQKMYDSAYYYAKISVEKLPRNVSHISTLQKILASKNLIAEAKLLFQNSKHIKDKIIWSNHAILLISISEDGEFVFGEEDVEFANEAYKLFPDDKYIKAAHKIVNSGYEMSIEANLYDSNALKDFEEKNYESAILNWEKAIDLIQNEDSYYLNIAQTYQVLKEFDKSIEVLRKLEKLGIKGDDGKFEFLVAISFYEIGNKETACKYAKSAKKYNYENSRSLVSMLCN